MKNFFLRYDSECKMMLRCKHRHIVLCPLMAMAFQPVVLTFRILRCRAEPKGSICLLNQVIRYCLMALQSTTMQLKTVTASLSNVEVLPFDFEPENTPVQLRCSWYSDLARPTTTKTTLCNFLLNHRGSYESNIDLIHSKVEVIFCTEWESCAVICYECSN